MRDRFGALLSISACLLLLAVLVWPYAVKSIYAINTYYRHGVLNPLFAGVLALAILVTFLAVRENYVSAELGAGIVLVLGISAFLVSLVWTLTARVDVFRAPGWALPAQRFILVGVAALIVFGAGWNVLTSGIVSVRSPRSPR
ncbi:DUF7548 family protein [Halomontanus rarus]|uniref:DUF7548 family protein n=1 Tax=Halomontanus rarus TaxID=3034020 RepID=UPI0023E817D2|nr:hypothetical protein [Halovivax sp. TS33]